MTELEKAECMKRYKQLDNWTYHDLGEKSMDVSSFCAGYRSALETKTERMKLTPEVEALIEALKYINDKAAPPMHKYTDIEFKMVAKAREALKPFEKEEK